MSGIKNLAIVAHVDHGKTTFVDELLKQTGVYSERDEIVDRVMDSGDIEKERGITITAKNCAVYWQDIKINLLDTPGHADFGGEVERSLIMVDGIILLVDASEGPLPQTRFVLEKAMQADLKIAVVINKIDRPDSRIDEVKGEVEDLLLELAMELDKEDFEVDLPFYYSSAKEGWATDDYNNQKENMHDILDFFTTDYFPLADFDESAPLQLLVANLAYSTFLGTQIVGRVTRGNISKNMQASIVKENGKENFKVSNIQVYDKLGTKEVDQAVAGEIVLVSGIDKASIGDTVCPPDSLDPLPRIEVEPPTVAVNVSVNTSPGAGTEGEYLTSRKLEEFLKESCLHNVALRYEGTDDPKVYRLKGRGELQLAIVFEELRRKGYEFMLSRPEVIFIEEDGETKEPFEKVVMSIPTDATGSITEEMASRKGLMENMLPISDTRTKIEFVIPSRGLIGYRSKFLTDTRGEGLMSSEFLGYRKTVGSMLARSNGAIISDRTGKLTPYALFNLLSNGEQFVLPGERTYEGHVIGQHTRENDTNVNAVREKHLSSVRTAGKDVNIILPPIKPRTLEWALDWIENDEWVEVSPENIRIRKKELEANKRSVVRREKPPKS